MRVFIALQLSVVALLTMAQASAQAPAPATDAPVKVTGCTVHAQNQALKVLTPNVDLTNGVTVTLQNASDKTVSAVTVSGNYHGHVVTDTAKLSLKPGDSIKVMRSYQPVAYIDPNAQCSVTHVDFDDGTSWSAPATPAPQGT